MRVRRPETHFDGQDNHEKVLSDVHKAFSKNISFGSTGFNPETGEDGLVTDNINNAFGTVTDTGVADTEFSVTHNLNRIPIGFWCIDQNKAGVYYHSGTTWTETQIFLKCSVANVAATFIII